MISGRGHPSRLGQLLLGKKSGRLTAVAVVGKSSRGVLLRCRCSCGNPKPVIVPVGFFGERRTARRKKTSRGGIVKSCGCLYTVIGRSYGDMTVVAAAPGKRTFRLRCLLGHEVIKSYSNFNRTSFRCLRCRPYGIVVDLFGTRVSINDLVELSGRSYMAVLNAYRRHGSDSSKLLVTRRAYRPFHTA